MIDVSIYSDNKPQTTVYVITRENTRVTEIGDIVFLPLFNKVDYRKHNLPTRQQIHSKKYYIETNHKYETTLKNPTQEEILEAAKNILKRKCVYAYTFE